MMTAAKPVNSAKRPGPLRRLVVYTLAMVVLPLCAHAVYHTQKGGPSSYWEADWSSSGILPKASDNPKAMVRVYAARTGRWKGIFAVHTWIVIKEAGARSYDRFDKVGWGSPIRINAYAPDARWYSNTPELVYGADGAAAEKLIPAIRAAVRSYRFRHRGDYGLWPGPNSNTFTACILAAVPQMPAILPPTAIGKDYPCDGKWLSLRRANQGLRLSFGGLAGINAGWFDGFEMNILGAIVGIDIRKPALKLPGFGRIGFAPQQAHNVQ
jgi:hypothetical protein